MLKRKVKGGKFSISQTYQDLLELGSKLAWRAVWCNDKASPRSQICMWQAIQNRLPTADRLRKWGVECNAICSLVKEEDENRDHLFHGCKYTKEVRAHISRFFIGIRWQNSFANEVQYMCRVSKRKNVKAQIVIMC